jgi:hypothetical protein
MEQKYILEIYDTIIREIKNPKKIFDTEILPSLKEWSRESFLIYTVFFIKQNGEINCQINKPLHNLHPNKPDITQQNFHNNSELEHFIPKLLLELNIQNDDKIYRWSTANEIDTLHILVDCNVEDLSNENRFFLYCANLLKNENQKIKRLNKERVFSLESREKMEHYIHKKQYALESLANRLIKDINPKTSIEIYQFSDHYDKMDCLKITYFYLEKLLRFVEKEYHNYLNVNIQIPYRSVLLKEFEITDKLNYVKSRLLESNINERLLKVAYKPLLKIATINIQEKLTYNQFNYSSEFIIELNTQLKLFNKEIKEIDVTNWLFDWNYNTLCFFNYETNTIKRTLDKTESNVQKIDVLYRFLKTYNQRQTRSFMKFEIKLPSIKEQIINWIEEEIEYLHKKIRLENNQIQTINIAEDKIKFLTGFSVAQLSYFFGLLIKVGIIKHGNHRDIFRFIADHFKTNTTDKISPESINSKYYNVEENTKKSVREKIIELLNLTKI